MGCAAALNDIILNSKLFSLNNCFSIGEHFMELFFNLIPAALVIKRPVIKVAI